MAFGLSRRDFLSACAAGTAVALAKPSFAEPVRDRRCIFLWLTGGPSHIDTFDPKPEAPAEVRGPFRPLQTRVPGLYVSELFPRLADRADRVAFIRSMHHDEAPIHETGQQLLQTGRFCPDREEPHVGAVLAASGRGPWAVLPGPLGDTGVDIGHGQSAGPLGPSFQPNYGGRPGLFLNNCMEAVRRIEDGYRMVVVNSHATVYDGESWDCHADGGRLNTTLDDYRALGPLFDLAFAAVIDRLEMRGLLDSTLVVAAGEFGRTPFLNSRGGRDHWPGVWTVLLAGAGIRGGAVVGSSDKLGGEPAERPVSPAEFVATIYHALDIDPLPLADTEPIWELF
ncbi:MAG TPA: DUF1501 domain-containing protein [Gemmataceae bacterium]|jgi:hypothetical protein|nr:DUF1501 domain-containing protein [Gemmataceae bacterium]